jgi:Fe-Mn family superoxide dismutase
MSTKHRLPALPYAASALEPYIDTRTMLLHHDQHHAAYVKALNHALESAPEPLREKPADWLLLNLYQVPDQIRNAVHHNAGGHLNHSLLWRSMSPHGRTSPGVALAEAIDATFGSIGKCMAQFEEKAVDHFGSGWVWLVGARNGDVPLRIITTSGHDNPLMQGLYPLLVNDVWEHAYYLKHQNHRADYLHEWWHVANWEEAGRRFEHSWQGETLDAESDADSLLEPQH